MLKLEDIYKLQIGKLIHNNIKKNNCITENLIPLTNLHFHNTRSRENNNFYLPAVRTNLGKTSFLFNGPKIWNSFPPDVRNSSSFIFKHALKNYLLQSYTTD